MPKTKFQDLIFTMIMVLIFVYVMTFYNAGLENGVTFSTFGYALKNMWVEVIGAFIAQRYIASKIVGSIFRGKEEDSRYILGQITSQPRADQNSSSELRATLKKELQEIRKQGRDGYLLMVGVDNFSNINLKYGREYGDTLLYNLAENMISDDARVDWVSRINGDCFCAILLDHSEENVKTYFSNLQKRMKEQCTISGGCVSLQAYQVPDGATLIQYAESSLQTAKASGKNRLSFFAPSDYERRLSEISLQEELEYGVKQDFTGFSLDYQAQVRSETFALYGAEALLRFCSPSRGPDRREHGCAGA